MSEHDEQVALVDWARMSAGQYPPLEWLFSSLNGAWFGQDRKRANAHASRLRREGMLPGVPDLFLPYPAQGYHGFFIEMKRPGNMKGVREGQKEFMEWAESVGYLCQVHDNFESAKDALVWYLSERQ